MLFLSCNDKDEKSLDLKKFLLYRKWGNRDISVFKINIAELFCKCVYCIFLKLYTMVGIKNIKCDWNKKQNLFIKFLLNFMWYSGIGIQVFWSK